MNDISCGISEVGSANFITGFLGPHAKAQGQYVINELKVLERFG